MQKESMLVIVGILVVSVVLLFAVDWLGVPTGKAIEFQKYQQQADGQGSEAYPQQPPQPTPIQQPSSYTPPSAAPPPSPPAEDLQHNYCGPTNVGMSLCTADGYACTCVSATQNNERPYEHYECGEKPCPYGCLPVWSDETGREHKNAICNPCEISSKCDGNDVLGCGFDSSGGKIWKKMECVLTAIRGCYKWSLVKKCKEVPSTEWLKGGAYCDGTCEIFQPLPLRRECENAEGYKIGCDK